MKVKGSFTLEAATIKILTHFTFPSHLYRILHLEQIEESPDEGDDEGGDDDEEEEVIVTETKVVSNVDCLSRGCACHTDDPKNLEGKSLRLQQNASIHSQSVKNAQLDVSGNSVDNVGFSFVWSRERENWLQKYNSWSAADHSWRSICLVLTVNLCRLLN